MTMRCTVLPDVDVVEFIRNPDVKSALDDLALPRGDAERVALARGAPGDLLSVAAISAARNAAERLLAAASSRGAERYAGALAQGGAGARGAFSDMLEELNVLLRESAEAAVEAGDGNGAYAAARAVIAVTEAQLRAEGNVNPQLTAALLMESLEGVSC
jgi:hypothetical protein